MAASEANGGSRGELLRQAIQEWVDDGAPTEFILRRDFRVDASPERLVTVDVPLHLFTAIGQAQRTTGANRATVLRGILRWFFKKYEQEITFGTKPISSNRAAEAVPARPILNHFDEEDDGLDGFSFQPTNPPTFLNLPIANAPRVTIDDVHRLEQAVTHLISRVLERHGDLPSHAGYDSTGLAAIDAVFSANAQYTSVQNIVTRITPSIAKWCGDDVTYRVFTLSRLLQLYAWIEEGSTTTNAAEHLANSFFGNRARIGGRLKADALESFAARILTAHERLPRVEAPLDDLSDFQTIWSTAGARDVGNALVRDATAVRGIGLATARYFLLLTGGPFVKPDRMTERFVAGVLGRSTSQVETTELLETAIDRSIRQNGYTYSVPRIDHLIWRIESGRLRV